MAFTAVSSEAQHYIDIIIKHWGPQSPWLAAPHLPTVPHGHPEKNPQNWDMSLLASLAALAEKMSGRYNMALIYMHGAITDRMAHSGCKQFRDIKGILPRDVRKVDEWLSHDERCDPLLKKEQILEEERRLVAEAEAEEYLRLDDVCDSIPREREIREEGHNAAAHRKMETLCLRRKEPDKEKAEREKKAAEGEDSAHSFSTVRRSEEQSLREDVRRLDGVLSSSSPLPSNDDLPICKFYSAGYCRRGSSCWFRHEDPVSLRWRNEPEAETRRRQTPKDEKKRVRIPSPVRNIDHYSPAHEALVPRPPQKRVRTALSNPPKSEKEVEFVPNSNTSVSKNDTNGDHESKAGLGIISSATNGLDGGNGVKTITSDSGEIIPVNHLLDRILQNWNLTDKMTIMPTDLLPRVRKGDRKDWNKISCRAIIGEVRAFMSPDDWSTQLKEDLFKLSELTKGNLQQAHKLLLFAVDRRHNDDDEENSKRDIAECLYTDVQQSIEWVLLERRMLAL